MKDSIPTPWLGPTRGYLSDWVTQKWVQLTGSKVSLDTHDWLSGPIAETTGIGTDYFERLGLKENLELRKGQYDVGLINNFSSLESDDFSVDKIDPSVRDFYEQTSNYDLDVWAEWSSVFKPFGRLLAYIFSRRLQQLNVPLSSLETSHGMTSEVIQVVEPNSGVVRYTAWLRHLVETGNVLYAGCYSVCRVPGFDGVCVKVVFPLPNGSAIVLMKPTIGHDGSLTISSSGKRFGDPGFYFVVHDTKRGVSARYVRAMRESIHIYSAENTVVRADHVLNLFGFTFLRLHYRMKRKVN
ncbi:MAG: hypothetical protein ACKVQJ_08230 [Pyrinomonadaceae bacterium]